MPLSEFYRLAKWKHKPAQQQQDQSAALRSGPGPSSSLHGGGFDQTSEHDDIVPWFSFNMDENEPLHQHNHSSDFFTEVPSVTAAKSSIHRTSFTPPNDRFPPFKTLTSDQKYSSSELRNLSSSRLKVSDTASLSSAVHPSMKDPGQRARVPSSSVIHFPHFTAMVKPGLGAISSKPNHQVPATKKHNGKEKVSVQTGGELASPSQVQVVTSESRKMSQSHHVGHSGNVRFQGSTRKIDISTRQEIVIGKKVATEPVVASSTCSANSLDRGSNDSTYSLKRKYNESEDSEYLSEVRTENMKDVEEESVELKQADNNHSGSGSKRSRAVEVHSLSERRRRDGINEKLRALQELIPNCSKMDKATMLDEAMEYLKTLQLQIQMMPLGASLCMPSMMLPHPMGIGMGYGISMLDMNMNSSNCPSMQIPPFPMAPVSQFGFQGQGADMLMLHSPIVTTIDLNTSRSGQISHSKDNVATPMPIADDLSSRKTPQ